MNKKNPWLASLFSLLVPGLGHLYAGHLKKAILIFLLLWPFIIIMRTMALIPYLFPVYYLSLVSFILYYIIDPFVLVKKNIVFENPWQRWYFYILFIGIQIISIPFIKGYIDKLSYVSFYSIPTPSMEPTLQVGDLMACKKANSLKRNEVCIFKYPEDPSTPFVKRCVGEPGDTIEIKEGNVYINGKLADSPEKMNFSYSILTDEVLSKDFFEKAGVREVSPTGKGYNVFTTEKISRMISSVKGIKSVLPNLRYKGEMDPMVFLQNEFF